MIGILFMLKKKKTINILYRQCIQVSTENTISEFYSWLNYRLYLNQQLYEQLAIGATRQNIDADTRESIDKIKNFLNINLVYS